MRMQGLSLRANKHAQWDSTRHMPLGAVSNILHGCLLPVKILQQCYNRHTLAHLKMLPGCTCYIETERVLRSNSVAFQPSLVSAQLLK